MTTVGYGDFYPGTNFGRIIIIFTAFWGTFLISLLILIAADVFELTVNEQKALNHLLQTRKAAQTITASLRYHYSKQRYLESMKLSE